MIKILFVCKGNVFRSVIAEYCLKKYLKENNLEDKYKIDSAGTIANPDKIHPKIISELSKLSIDVSKHKQKKVTEELAKSFDVVIAMAENHKTFLKQNYKINAPLFNFICYGKNESVL